MHRRTASRDYGWLSTARVRLRRGTTRLHATTRRRVTAGCVSKCQGSRVLVDDVGVRVGGVDRHEDSPRQGQTSTLRLGDGPRQETWNSRVPWIRTVGRKLWGPGRPSEFRLHMMSTCSCGWTPEATLAVLSFFDVGLCSGLPSGAARLFASAPSSGAQRPYTCMSVCPSVFGWTTGLAVANGCPASTSLLNAGRYA